MPSRTLCTQAEKRKRPLRTSLFNLEVWRQKCSQREKEREGGGGERERERENDMTPPPPPNNINTAHRGRFQVNVNPIGDSK